MAVGISNSDQIVNVSCDWCDQHHLLFGIMHLQHCNMEMCKSLNVVAYRVVNDPPCII